MSTMIPVQTSNNGKRRVSPLYGIDHSCINTGKRIAATKRCIRFSFGFSNTNAIAEGRSGPECRGEEHQVELIWSMTSGKHIISFDGQEVHHSKNKRVETKFEFSWSIAGNHIIKIIAHATHALGNPAFRQFDLLVNGCSYFDMPYELGKRELSKESITKKTKSVIPTVPSTDTSNSGNKLLHMDKSSSGSLPARQHAEKISKSD